MAKKPIPKKISQAQAVSVASAQSTRAATAELPFAIIEHAKDNSLLYPLDARLGTTAKLTLPAGSTRVIVHFAIKGQVCATFPPISVTSGDIADIPWQWISTCIGHTVLIWYEAVVGGVRKESLVLELEIQDVREEHLRSSMPEFANAEWDWGTLWLDMFELDGNEIIRVEAWPMIRAGSRLFVAAAGNEEDVPPLFHWVAFDHVVTEEEAHEGYVFEFELSRPWLARLNDYTSCTCHLGVIWDGCEPEAPVSSVNPLPRNAQDFHQRSTVLLRVDPALDLNAPRLEESVETSPDDWQVNPENTTKGGHVIVAYQGMTKDDRVCVQASGLNYGPVSLGCQDVKAGDELLSFDVSREIFPALFCQNLTLTYSVQFNKDDPQNSPERVIRVLAPRLPLPCIEEATLGIVDLIFSVTGVVPVWDYAKEGECCWMWVSGTREGGIAYRFDVLLGQPLTAEWLTNGVKKSIPQDELNKLADCTRFKLHFAASFDGKCDRKTAFEFPPATFTIHKKPLTPRAPTVKEAQGGVLVPWNAKEGAHIYADYDGFQPSHEHTAQWRLDGENSFWPLELQESMSGLVTFRASREQVINSFRKTAVITYTVINACKLMKSGELKLQVGEPLMERRPRARLTRATEDTLDLRTLHGKNPQVIVKSTDEHLSWWFFVEGHLGGLEIEGVAEDGSPHTITIMDNEPLGERDMYELSRDIPYAKLEELKDNTDFTVKFWQIIGQDPAKSVKIEFQSLTLRLRKYYYQLTGFDTLGDFEGWEQGAGAPDSRDLSFERYGNGYAIKNYTYTNKNIGPILQKDFALDPQHEYEFSAKVRRYNNADPEPKLSLYINGLRKSEIEILDDQTWRTLRCKFVATGATRAAIYSHEKDEYASGNDYLIDDMLLKEVEP
ncbi:hypothetical protein C4J96_3614 [Pseudomonas orientalis]|uniref:hypothetical protein n=1 Tax=Pseudomonas orientalis TaxID=76758 RepID=UPI000F58DF1C|nr:hypothetical protein [Pseudomonas orientalis]AZE95713.1 hypothetical protein C4J96_3614 [Pseudomonas orientalis]